MKEKPNFDFAGYATKNDVRCTDGRVIRQDAFKHDDGRVVPLVWQHGINDPSNILGHAELENRPDGVYARCYFNDSSNAANAKNLVKHGAINALSIYAGKLGQIGKDVMSGVIKEVSLVLSGANPGALIDNVAFSHGEFDEDIVEEAIIYTGENLTLSHSDDEDEIEEVVEEVVVPEIVHATASASEPAVVITPVEVPAATDETVGDILATLNDEQKAAVGFMLEEQDAASNGVDTSAVHAETAKPGEKTVGDVLATLSDKQKAAVGFLIEEMDKESTDGASAQHSEMENDHMKTNVFDQNDTETEVAPALTHEDFMAITEAAKKNGSFKNAFFQHMEEAGYELQHDDAATYGLNNVGLLFPDARSVTPNPDMIQRDTGWVGTVMSGTKHSPFSRIKSLAADITADEARAKGYIKGTEKVNEVFDLLSRPTEPTTVYKKQKMDRDDVLDITDFDVVLWLRSEMRLMLDEEIARAILIGDGRAAQSNDKIKEDRIRPIYTDVALYAPHVDIKETDPGKQVDEVVRAMRQYKGSGNPTLFVSPDVVTDLLLTKDTLMRRLYPTMAELAAALRVKNIVEVEIMSGVVNPDNQKPLFGIAVNLGDYTVGSDKGGEVNAFDDFDINFNQLHYLIETRISGALTKPKAALVLELNPTVPDEG